VKKIIYVLFLSFATLNFVGCSDGYDEALQDTTPKEITKEDVQKATDDAQKEAEKNNVELSSETKQKFEEFNNTLNNFEQNLDSNESVSALDKVNLIIQQASDVIVNITQDVEDSNISTKDKNEAIAKLKELQEEIERKQFKEGLKAYTESLQNNNSTYTEALQNNNSNSNECPSTDNTSSLPPAVPSDQCTNKQ